MADARGITPALSGCLLWIVAAIFLVGLPRTLGWTSTVMGALRQRSPYLQVGGHTYRRQPGEEIRPISVGTAPTADLRLTESGVPHRLATLELASDQIRYLHETTTRSAQFLSIDDGLLARVGDDPGPVAIRTLGDAERLVWADRVLDPVALTAACDPAGTPPEDVATADVALVDAAGVWIADRDGESRTLELPRLPGARKAVGDGFLYFDGDHLWLTPARSGDVALQDCWDCPDCGDDRSACLDANRAVLHAAGVLIARDSSRPWISLQSDWIDADMLRRDISPELAQVLDLSTTFAHTSEGLSAPRTLFYKPAAYLTVNDGPAEGVGVTGAGAGVPVGFPFQVLRRKAHAESSAPWLRRLGDRLEEPQRRPRVARRPGDGTGPATRVYRCSGDTPQELGAAHLSHGDVLIAGASHHYRLDGDLTGGSDPLALWLTAPPRGRVALLSSLSSARLRSENTRIPVPSCDDDAQLVLRGASAPEVFTEAAPPTHWNVVRDSRTTVDLPLPAWAAHAVLDPARDGRFVTELLSGCVDSEGRLKVDVQAPDVVRGADGALADGAQFEAGGHLLRYYHRPPWLEQLLPMGGFLLLISGYALAAIRRIRLGGGSGSVTSAATWAVGIVGALMAAGAVLQLRMAVSARLLGDTDYLHRHLITGVIAMAALCAVVHLVMDAAGPQRDPDSGEWRARTLLESWREWLPAAIRHAGVLLASLTGWFLLDAIAWAAFGPEGAATLRNPAVDRTVVVGIVGTGALAAILIGLAARWNALLPAAGRLVTAARERGATAWDGLRERIPPRLIDLWSRDGLLALVVGVATLAVISLAFHWALGLLAGLIVGALSGAASRHRALLLRRGGVGVVLGALVFGVTAALSIAGLGLLFGLALGVAVGIAAGVLASRDPLYTVIHTAVTSPPPPESRPLWIGVAILAIGRVLGSSDRGIFGFDLKPAEFAPIFIGLGHAGLLVGLARYELADSSVSLRRYGTHIRTFLWLLFIAGVVGVLYASLGDFGPLMVLVPALVLSTLLWAPEWRAGRARGPGELRTWGGRLAVGLLTAAVIWLLAHTGTEMLTLIQDRSTEIPLIGADIERAVDRFETYRETWFTQQGEWVTRAHWIAAGYFGSGERFLSNLHSDLAYLAVIHVFGTPRAFLVLGLFVLLAVQLARLSESTLQAASDHVRRAIGAREMGICDRTQHHSARSLARQSAIAAFFGFFVTCYLLCEMLVHISTCFNTLPQTGITLPWISSGGSASVGFAILVGFVVGTVLRTRQALHRHHLELVGVKR